MTVEHVGFWVHSWEVDDFGTFQRGELRFRYAPGCEEQVLKIPNPRRLEALEEALWQTVGHDLKSALIILNLGHRKVLYDEDRDCFDRQLRACRKVLLSQFRPLNEDSSVPLLPE